MVLKLISLNIWCGGMLMEKAIKFLRKEKADIVCLQEAYNGSGDLEPRFKTVEYLKKNLDYKYGVFIPEYLDRDAGFDTGQAVLSNFIIEENTPMQITGLYEEGSMSVDFAPFAPRVLQHCVLKINSQTEKLHVLNFHGIWDVHGRDTEKRLEMSRKIVNTIDKINTNQKIILCGDFNCNPDTRTIADIEVKLKNVFKEELLSKKISTTFNMKHKKEPVFANLVVDFIFVSSNIEVVSRKCLKSDVSDHLPLVLECKI